MLIGIAQIFIVRAKRGTFLHIRQDRWEEQKQIYWDEFIRLLKPLAQREEHGLSASVRSSKILQKITNS
jgi:hypothetical protein